MTQMKNKLRMRVVDGSMYVSVADVLSLIQTTALDLAVPEGSTSGIDPNRQARRTLTQLQRDIQGEWNKQ